MIHRSLLIDVGNSRMKWAVARDGLLEAGRAVEHCGEPARVLADIVVEAADSVWVADVMGGELREGLCDAIRSRGLPEPCFVASEAERDGLVSCYAQPQRMGVDRWLMLLAAWTRHRCAACVVSAGTALTFDAVDADGRHLGGVIAPGLRAMQKAVLGTTRFEAAGPQHDYEADLGCDTEACVRQGALHAAAGMIDSLAQRYGEQAICWISGGDATVLQPQLSTTWTLRPDLVLEGLSVLAMDALG